MKSDFQSLDTFISIHVYLLFLPFSDQSGTLPKEQSIRRNLKQALDDCEEFERIPSQNTKSKPPYNWQNCSIFQYLIGKGVALMQPYIGGEKSKICFRCRFRQSILYLADAKAHQNDPSPYRYTSSPFRSSN